MGGMHPNTFQKEASNGLFPCVRAEAVGSRKEWRCQKPERRCDFDLFEAEDHRNKGVENDYHTFVVPSDWREDAEKSKLIASMREFRAIVKEMQDEALR